MFANPQLRVFRLSADHRRDAISCDADGAYVGLVPLLKRTRPASGVPEQWTVRPEKELNAKLALLYGMPIDVSAKIGGMETVARALNDGRLALAKIAAVQLRFPDPPGRPRTTESRADRLSLATELYWSALLKADDEWDDKHPRTGTKPNPGWFARKPGEPNLPGKPGWPLPAVNAKARQWIAKVAKEEIVPKAGRLILEGIPIVEAISAFVDALEPTDLNGGEDRLVAQMRANFDPPKTLEELGQPPTENPLGYERHHIVEQTDNNIQKGVDLIDTRLVRFGRDKIEDPSNIVWVPRLKHIEISGYYSSKPDGSGINTPTVRQQLSTQDFAAQRAAGLEALRKYGVLQ